MTAPDRMSGNVWKVFVNKYGNPLALLCQQLSNKTVRQQKNISVLICLSRIDNKALTINLNNNNLKTLSQLG